MAVDINSRDARNLRKLIPLNTLSKMHFAELCANISIAMDNEGAFLFKQQDADTDLFYLLEGEIALQADDFIFETIKASSEAARFAISHQIPRQVDAIATSNIRFIKISPELLDFDAEAAPAEETGYVVYDETDTGADDWMTTIIKSPMLQNLPPANLQQILIGIGEVTYKSAERIITQDEKVDYFYLLRSGQCQITRKPTPNAKDVKLGTLQEKDTFGEDALIPDEPSHCSITALSDTSLLRLEKAKFLSLIAEPLIPKMDYQTVQQELNNGSVLIDVRLPDQFSIQHLPDSTNIPFFSLRMQLKTLVRNKPTIFVCEDGKHSTAAAFYLLKNRYKACVLEGGLKKTLAKQKKHSKTPTATQQKAHETHLEIAEEIIAETAERPDEHHPLQAENTELRQEIENLQIQNNNLLTKNEQLLVQLQTLTEQLKTRQGQAL